MSDPQRIITTWQNRLDREFPEGAVCTWDQEGDHLIQGSGHFLIYLIPKIEVIDAHGLDPVVRLVPLDQSRVLIDWVTSYNDAEGGRWAPGTKQVTFGTFPGVMFWSPKVPAVMRANRVGEAEPEPAP